MKRKFIVDEDDLREMLFAQMRDTMASRNDQWGESFNEIIHEFYPMDVSDTEIDNGDIGFQECVDAILDSGRYEELNGTINKLSALLDLHSALRALD